MVRWSTLALALLAAGCAPSVVSNRQLDIRQLLIDAVRRWGTLGAADYFHSNWKIVPSRTVTDAYGSMHRRTLNR